MHLDMAYLGVFFLCVDNATREGEVHYAFLALQEILPNDTVVQRVSLQDGFLILPTFTHVLLISLQPLGLWARIPNTPPRLR